MSEIPPINEPSNPDPSMPPPRIGDFSAPPPAYAAYTRPGPFAGSPDHLEAVADGYYGLNWVFLFNVIWAVAGIGFIAFLSQNNNPIGGIFALVFVVLSVPVMAFASYKSMKKLAFGMNWSPTVAIVLAICLGFSVLCIGIFAYIILQMLAAAEIRKYPVKKSFLGGFRKKDLKALVAEMRASPQYRQQQAAPAPGQR